MSLSQGYYRVRRRSSASSSWSSWAYTYCEYEPVSIFKERDGTNCPNWKKLRDSGAVLPFNRYVHKTTTITRQGRTGHIDWYSDGSSPYIHTQEEWSNYFVEPVYPASPGIDNYAATAAVNDAIASATAPLVMLPVTILEARETLKMLKATALRLYNFGEFLWELSKRRKESFSALWLEYRLGWTPFYYELIGFINIVNGKLKKGTRVHGTGMKQSDHHKTHDLGDSSAWFTDETSLISTVNQKFRGVALGEVDSEIMARFGLNPLMVIWESITLSWLFDKFIQVGNWLASISNGASGFAVVSSGYTLKYNLEEVYTSTWTANRVSTGGGGSGSGGSMTRTSTVKAFYRQPDSGGGLPYLDFSLSPVDILDILALIAQFRKWKI